MKDDINPRKIQNLRPRSIVKKSKEAPKSIDFYIESHLRSLFHLLAKKYPDLKAKIIEAEKLA
jgi:hypothetical protein